MSDTDWYAYVAFADDCQCLAAVAVDEPAHKKDVATFVADKVRRGFRVERMRGDAFRKVPLHCEIHPEGRWPEPSPEAERDWRGRFTRSRVPS